MLFDLDSKTFQVRFYRTKSENSENKNPTTVAELFIKDGEDFVALDCKGFAFCNPKDRFEKSKGRKIALADLIWQWWGVGANYTISKEDRAKIWEIYFQTHRKA